jgi:hypothetical protein
MCDAATYLARRMWDNHHTKETNAANKQHINRLKKIEHIKLII